MIQKYKYKKRYVKWKKPRTKKTTKTMIMTVINKSLPYTLTSKDGPDEEPDT